jgi:cobalt-zinc-cadmium efflux system outer membrane protein
MRARFKQRFRAMNAVMAVSSLVALPGCSFYHRLPLTSEAVEAKLRPPGAKALVIAAAEIQHPLLRPVRLDASDGLSPGEAAVLAVILNPSLRATRDQRKIARAQVIQAGILPNPQLSGNLDYVTGGNTLDTLTGFAYGLSWDLRSLLTVGPNIAVAKASQQAVYLDVAWQEWQIALAAQAALYNLAALRAQVAQAEEIDTRLASNAALMKKAEEAHENTVLDSTAAEASANNARAILLGLRQDLGQRRIALNRAIGYPADTKLRLQDDVSLPSRVNPPSEATLLCGLEGRRLDLLALKRGYESQDAMVRAAIIAQFPIINVGFNRASDTGNVHTGGPGATIGIPIFNRNQGNVAITRATREQLFDEYTNRVFAARTDISAIHLNIHWLNARVAQAERALPALRRLVQVSEEALRQGNANVLGTYTARNNLTQQSIEILKLKQELAISRIALETAAAWHISP